MFPDYPKVHYLEHLNVTFAFSEHNNQSIGETPVNSNLASLFINGFLAHSLGRDIFSGHEVSNSILLKW